MRKLLERITKRGAERSPEGAAAPQDISEAEPTLASPSTPPAHKPPPSLPLFFMVSHLEDDGPVRLDGVKLGVCEVMGLELDEPKLGAFAGALNACDFSIQLLIRQHPPRLGPACGRALQKATAGGPAPADEGGGRVPPAAAHRPGGPRRHPRPAFLRRGRVRAG